MGRGRCLSHSEMAACHEFLIHGASNSVLGFYGRCIPLWARLEVLGLGQLQARVVHETPEEEVTNSPVHTFVQTERVTENPSGCATRPT